MCKRTSSDSAPSPRRTDPSNRLRAIDIATFAMLGAMMFASKLIMEALPNIHLLGLFIVATTVVYRRRALYPIYVFVLLQGLFGGFTIWWISYLYVWTVLWGMVMLLPRRMPLKVGAVVYPLVAGVHGLLFGVLCAPVQALFFGLDVQGTLAWIAAGFWFDIIHAVSNVCAGLLIVPLVLLLRRLSHRREK